MKWILAAVSVVSYLLGVFTASEFWSLTHALLARISDGISNASNGSNTSSHNKNPLAAALTIDPSKLAGFFVTELAMHREDAAALAAVEGPKFAACGISFDKLTALKKVLHAEDGLNFRMGDVRKHIFDAAYQQVSPKALQEMYQFFLDDMRMKKEDARRRAMEFAARNVKAKEVQSLFETLNKRLHLRFVVSQQNAAKFAGAGADADACYEAFMKSEECSKNQKKHDRNKQLEEQCLDKCAREAVAKNLNGVIRRYDKNMQAGSARDFQAQYGDKWFQEWIGAPEEKRVAKAGNEVGSVFAKQFRQRVGEGWESSWQNSPVATQLRLSDAGESLTMQQFHQQHGNKWQKLWLRAPQLPCLECVATCSAADDSCTG